MSSADRSASSAAGRSAPVRLSLAFGGAALLLLLGVLASLALGAVGVPLERVFSLLFSPDASSDSLIIHTLRLPRTVVAALAGSALGVAGALLQGVTRNPLADPGILGVEAGAAFAVLVMVVFFPGLGPLSFVPLAFLGGAVAAAVAFGVASGVGLTPLRLALAGVAVGALISAGSRSVQLLFEDRAQAALFSLAGSVAGRTWGHALQVAPWTVAGVLLACALARRLNLLALGEDVARGLGLNTGRDRAFITALGVLLAAAAVSVAGPVGFVGLIVPHAARRLVGPDHTFTLPISALLGAGLLIWADVAARLIDRPSETPVGLLVAALGAPFFVLLVRSLGKAD